jgi:hypothetical protein
MEHQSEEDARKWDAGLDAPLPHLNRRIDPQKELDQLTGLV